MASPFDAIARATIGAMMGRFGVSAIMTDLEDAESDIRVVLSQRMDPVGEYGERMERRYYLEIASDAGAAVGALVAIGADVYRLEQIQEDDGLVSKWAARRVEV